MLRAEEVRVYSTEARVGAGEHQNAEAVVGIVLIKLKAIATSKGSEGYVCEFSFVKSFCSCELELSSITNHIASSREHHSSQGQILRQVAKLNCI